MRFSRETGVAIRSVITRSRGLVGGGQLLSDDPRWLDERQELLCVDIVGRKVHLERSCRAAR
jgi:hypothetical protein